MGRLIQVFEHDKLTSKSLCSKGEILGDKIIDKLWQYNDSNKNIYFEAIRHGVKFKNYVGVIQIGGTTIEILPKADKLNTQSPTEKDIWHKILLKMLAHCKKIKVNAVSEASLRKRYQSLLDLYFELYLSEVSQLLQKGLIKKYNQKSGNIVALKGRLDFAKNIQQNVIRQERFFTTHQLYDYNHLVNQILYKALKVLKLISNNTYLIDGVNRLIAGFPEINEIEINKSHFDKVTSNRKTEPYNEALKIAKMILLNYSPDIKGGDENMLALLFDMNKLWEEYIYRMLSRCKKENVVVDFQNSQEFFENRTIRPDLVLTKKVDGITETYIIDTKWKILDVSNPKPSDDDLKQMFAYNLYWNAKRSMLLYPNSKGIQEAFGNYHKGRDVKPFEKEHNIDYDRTNQCKVGFVNVLDNSNQLNLNIGKEIFEKIIK